jgi:hypothetical protein
MRASATFGDLVAAARVLIRGGQADSTAACLLASDAGGFVLGADLMPALATLPDAPVELDAQLQNTRGPARVLTAWGPAGRGEPQLALTAFTSLPAESVRASVVALVLTDQGVYVRFGANAVGGDGHAQTIEAAVARVLAAPGNSDGVLYVSAEATTPLSALAQLLRTLPVTQRVALSIVLPPGTSLPAAAPAAAASAADHCSEGLPDLGADEAEGELDSAAIAGALGPLQSAARECIDSAAGPARAGGRFAIALRIGRDGGVTHACLQQDTAGDATLAACVLAGARQLRFPAPQPAGSVDVLVPLSLTPRPIPLQRALCE